MSLEADVFRGIFNDVKKRGKLVSPRGQLVLEIEDYNYVLPPFVRFQNFTSRKLSLKYIAREFLWYLRGDRFDTSICEHAKMWSPLVNKDGSINSNYGQYIFGSTNQFDNVVRTLTKDKDSRRASVSILNSGHLISDTNDVPCTYSLNFRIRNDHLHMSVAMRSQDAVFGMGNDAPAFSFVHEMVYVSLKATYPELQMGRYHHYANSFHVYERHFDLLEKIVAGDSHTSVDCPRILDHREIDVLRSVNQSSVVNDEFKFTRWLIDGGSRIIE